jgi:hypothetical protein
VRHAIEGFGIVLVEKQCADVVEAVDAQDIVSEGQPVSLDTAPVVCLPFEDEVAVIREPKSPVAQRLEGVDVENAQPNLPGDLRVISRTRRRLASNRA